MLKLFTDGGVIKKNPSTWGGTWAWCVVHDNTRILARSGVVTPQDVGLPTVTNNLTELLAAVDGLENIDTDTVGKVIVFTDSIITLHRLVDSPAFLGIPAELEARTLAVRPKVADVVLLSGHPTKAELSVGVGKKGWPVSPHNVWCDQECKRRAAEFLATLQPVGAP